MTTVTNEGLDQPIDHYYNMNHKKRGVALIFNHEEFDDDDWPVRNGTQFDCDNLVETFTALNFDVRVHEDRTKSQLKKILEKLSNENHSDNDCLVVILLTHGEVVPVYNKALEDEGNTVLSHDLVSFIHTKDKKFALQKVFRYFTNERCPSLANKPRIFLVQACQGTSVDEGMTLHRFGDKETEMDAILFRSKPTDKILPQKDFLIAYSSLPGFRSFRNKFGSCFIKALCKELNEYKYQFDFMKILTMTCQTVAYEFESKSLDPNVDKSKQIPCIQSMLTKLLVFKDKQLLKN